MTTTAAKPTTTGHRIGTCTACGARYYAAKGTTLGFCSCRAAEGIAQTFITPKTVKAIKSDHKCDAACTMARRTLCTCECGGDGHGSALPVTA